MSTLYDQLEIDYGTSILEELIGENLTRKGQRVRLFDQTEKSAEAYYPSDEQGKPYVQNFQEGKRWYPITAWMESHDVDWQTAVDKLKERYLVDSLSCGKIHGRLRSKSPIIPTPKPPASYHDSILVEATLGHYERNNFAIFLQRLFGKPIAEGLLTQFHVGTCLEGIAPEWARSTVFWQLDEQGQAHSGKVIYYNLAGKRMKEKRSDFNRPLWLHDVMAMRAFNLEQCLFGLHQLRDQPVDKPIAIVESEKTAIICTAFMPDFIWLACGGKANLHADRFKPLTGRTIVLFPDLGGFSDWTLKAEELRRTGHTVSVSRILEDRAASLDRHAGLDLADFLTPYRCPQTGRVLISPNGPPAFPDDELAKTPPDQNETGESVSYSSGCLGDIRLVNEVTPTAPDVSTPFRLPKTLEYKWKVFTRPPFWWNRIGTYKSLMRCIGLIEPVTKTISILDELLDSPSGCIVPACIESLLIESPDIKIRPDSRNKPHPPDIVPKTSAEAFHEFQQQNPYFSQMGLASIQSQ